MSTTVVGRAARMTGLKKPRPLRRIAVDRDTDVQESKTVDLESRVKRLSLIQSRAEEFIKSSQSCEDERESPTEKSSLNHQTEPKNQNLEQLTMTPTPDFKKHNIVSDTNNNICPMPGNNIGLFTSNINSTLSKRPQGFPHPQMETKSGSTKHSSNAETQKNSPKSFTAIINLKGDGKDERLVLASTSMKSILKAANLLACHMNGELVYIDSSDGDSPQVNTQKEKPTSSEMSSTPTAFPSRPSRGQLQAHMPELPDLVRADYGRSDRSFGCVERQLDWRFLNRSERRDEVANNASCVKGQQPVQCKVPSVQYTVKDLLMMARDPHAKIPPRNWPLIKEAFPELVAHEERYFEPLDLKACSPFALGRPRSVDFDYRVDCMELR